MDFTGTSLGIELGSTRIKAVLIDEKHIPIASGDFEWENQFVNGIWTYSLEDVKKAVLAALKELEDVPADELVEARKKANKIADEHEKAIAYHDTVEPKLDDIRYQIDKLELVVDDGLWPLPKYRELLFIR